MDVLRTQGVDGDSRHERGVDAPRQADDRVGEAVLAEIIAGPQHERLVDLGLLPERRGGRRDGTRPGVTGRLAHRPRRQGASTPSEDLATSTVSTVSRNAGAAATAAPDGSMTKEAPSKTSSSCPPTWLT